MPWCPHGSEPPGLGHVSHAKSKRTRLSKMLHFSFVFGAWLHKPEEFGDICFGGQALALWVFPFLQDYCHHLSSCARLGVRILAPQPTADINRENSTLSCNCSLSAAAHLLIGIWMSKSGQFYGVLPVVTHWFFQHLRHQCLCPAERSLSTHYSSSERAAESLLTLSKAAHTSMPTTGAVQDREGTG